MGDSDFKELLHTAEQLSSEAEVYGELPKVDRTLRQVLEASHELWTRVATSGAQETQANLLLGTKGIDLTSLSQKLDSLTSRKTFEPLDPIPDNDIQSFLKNEMETAILTLIEGTHKKTQENLEQRHAEKLDREWAEMKNELISSFLSHNSELLQLPSRPEPTQLNETTFGLPSGLDQQDMAYAQCVIDYNTALIQGKARPNLQDMFAKVSSTFNNQKVAEMWSMFNNIIDIPLQAERDAIESRKSRLVQEIMIQKARNYLEQRYRDFMSSVVASHLNEAKRGGTPGTLSLVRGFVAVRVPPSQTLEATLVQGQCFWPLLYYCLRLGDVRAALTCLAETGQGNEELVLALNEMAENQFKMCGNHEKAVRSAYRRIVRNSPDCYKRIVYCMVGGCDVSDSHSEVIQTADDYLWLRLCQVRFASPADTNQAVTDKLLYPSLQTLILEDYGEKHYKADLQPHVYVQMLLLTGQWEAAIEFLMRHDRFRVHAAHMALVLHELFLLATPPNVNSPFVTIDPSDPKPMRRINFCRTIKVHTQKFEATNPREALHYYFILRRHSSSNGQDMFSFCVSDLVLETREFDLILGRLEPDGCRAPGLLDTFNVRDNAITEVVERVAQTAEKRGQHEDAIKLYDLAGVHEKVLILMTTLLSQLVSKNDPHPTSLRSRTVSAAHQLSKRYAGVQLSARATTLATFNCMRDLTTFFETYHANDYAQALEIIQKSRLIPLSLEEVEEIVNNFRLLHEELKHTIPDVLLATMNMLYHNYRKLRGESSSSMARLEDFSKEKQLSFLRERARSLTSFAGTVPYRMPGDTNARLVQTEILMH